METAGQLVSILTKDNTRINRSNVVQFIPVPLGIQEEIKTTTTTKEPMQRYDYNRSHDL